MGCGLGFSVGHRILDMEGIRPMSDTLRTRIAAVLGANSHMSRELQDHLADAVIEALNLDVAVTYLSVDKLRREFCVEGHYTVEVNDA